MVINEETKQMKCKFEVVTLNKSLI